MVVCGEKLDADSVTTIGDANSAIEGLSVTGGGTKRLAFQLIAAKLNCIVSGASDCSGISIEDTYNACDAACTSGNTTVDLGNGPIDCISALDAFNNGEVCHVPVVGLCKNAQNQSILCTGNDDADCTTNCKSPSADAGPSQAAKDSACTVVPAGEHNCTSGKKCNDQAAGLPAESCLTGDSTCP